MNPDDAIKTTFPHAEIVPDTFDADLDEMRQIANRLFAGVQHLPPADRTALLDKWMLT